MRKATRRQALQLVAGAAGAIAARPPRVARADDNDIAIGGIYSLSGIYAIIGQPIKQAHDIAVDFVNSEGGVLGRKLKSVVMDDQFNPNLVLSSARELVGNGTNFIVAGPQGPEVIPLLPIVKDTSTIFLACGSTSLLINHENFNRNTFHMQNNSYAMMNGQARLMAATYPNVKHWVVIAPDVGFGHDTEKNFTLFFKKYMPDAVFDAPIYTPLGATEYKNQVYQILSSGAEGLYCSISPGPDGISFYQQMTQLGLGKKIKANASIGGDLAMARALGKNMVPHFWTIVNWYWDDAANAESQMFYREYVKRTKDPYPFHSAALIFDAVRTLAKAIREAGTTDRDTIIKVLENSKFDMAVAKQVGFRKEDHQMLHVVKLLNIEPSDNDPYFMAAGTKTVPTADVIEPASPGKPFAF